MFVDEVTPEDRDRARARGEQWELFPGDGDGALACINSQAHLVERG